MLAFQGNMVYHWYISFRFLILYLSVVKPQGHALVCYSFLYFSDKAYHNADWILLHSHHQQNSESTADSVLDCVMHSYSKVKFKG